MKTISNKTDKKQITAQEFDKKFDRGEDITSYLDFEKAIVVKRVNIDFPTWMIDSLDREADRLNVSRQAVVKVWISERLKKEVA